MASFVTLVVALVACVGVGIAATATDSGPLRSATSSTLGIFVDAGMTEEEMQQAGIVGNDSNLGIFVTSAASEDITMTFMAQGSVFETVRLGYGTLLSAPARVPEWTGPWGGDAADPPAPRPVFGGWCTDEAGSAAYDFSTPVTRDTTLYAGWDTGTKVKVTLHGLGGKLDDPAGLPGELDEVVVERYLGSTYRSLPTPARTGYTFAGWWSADGRSTGAWGARVEATTPVGDVAQADHDLYARWQANAYFVRYVNNVDAAGGGAQHEASAVYDAPLTLLTWQAVQAQGFYVPTGKAFAGWNARPDATGTTYAAGTSVTNLATEEGSYVALYAEWIDDGTVDPGPFDVTFVYDDATPDTTVTVARGERVPEPETPKKTGYQFAEWLTPLGEPWDFASPVYGHLTLNAQWNLRLDVTLPVSVGFAVDAESHKVTTPKADLYAIKSRTVVPVQVEEMAVISQDEELETFFDLAGEEPEGEDARKAAWKKALMDTALWVWKTGSGGASSWTTDFANAPDGDDALSFALPLANEAGERGEYARVEPDGTLGEKIEGWRNAALLGDNENFRLEKFVYGNTGFDEAWQGGDPSVRLPLKFGMKISDELEVETALDSPKPLTHLIVTVSAQG